MNNGFYKAFADRFRGSRETVKERMRVYLQFVEPFKKAGVTGRVFDIGCGRGEWIELMVESGFDVYGMDLDEGMLAECYEKCLPALKGDAVEFIKKLENESHLIVSAFQLVEHISFEDLDGLVKEALRILVPGGLLIMETPNPENLIVATKNFYLDPTHKKPVPPELLSFLPEYHGFERVKVLRLQESTDNLKSHRQGLYAFINGVSPDYSVIAQKAAPSEMFAGFDQAFNIDFGLTLEKVSSVYDNSILQHIERIEANSAKAEAHARESELKAAKAEKMATEAQGRAEQTEALVRQIERSVNAICSSFSWRITRPLRRGLGFVRKAANIFRSGFKKTMSEVVQIPLRIAFKIYPLRMLGNWLLRRFPVLNIRFRRIIDLYNSYKLLNTQTQELEVLLAEPEDEKYIPDKLRVSSLVEKDISMVSISEVIFKVKDEYTKRGFEQEQPQGLFDMEMEKIRKECL